MDAVDSACQRFNLQRGEHCKDESCVAALAAIRAMMPDCATQYGPFPQPAAIEEAYAKCA